MPQNRNNKLYIAMVGLPARGKSTLAARLRENLLEDGIKAKIFNNGDLRRSMVQGNTSCASFYDPNNLVNVNIRENIARVNIKNAWYYLQNKGNVAILDATHVSKQRRKLLCSLLSDQPILFIQCLNNDPDILQASIAKKATLPEFEHLSHKSAIECFENRICYYENIYSPFSWERNYINFDSLDNQILESKIQDEIPYFEQIRDLLVTDSVKNLFLIRHGESYDNLENRIGGDASLTEVGKTQAKKLGRHFRKTKLPYIFSSRKRRAIETAEPICSYQDQGIVISLPEFNEIDSGICEEMSYQEIKKRMPEVYEARQKDKYHYIYPQGEGYVSMRKRIDKGIKKALFLSGNANNIMIVGHRAVNRMILSHFLYRRIEDVPYIYVPQDRYYHIISTQKKKLFELKWIKQD